MKKISCLNGFCYYDIGSKFQLTAETRLDYFKSEVLGEKEWDGKKIFLSDSATPPKFDSGIVCSLCSNLNRSKNTINALNCFFAPYQLMNETIKARDVNKRSSKNNHRNSIAIGIGMVLSIIATKGSSETGIRKPYVIFVNRGTLGVRNGELDVPVVEGLNCSDFKLGNKEYSAMLETIAKRALYEERGLNCKMLDSMGVLHLPKKYYLGYDKKYMQWNFFGTVVVDCTVEEIVREGFYYTKDKFESTKIIAIPAETQVLYYHLSEKTLQCKNAKSDKSKQFWNTAWASVSFALKDFSELIYNKKTHSSVEEKLFHVGKSFPSFVAPVRKTMNNFARFLEKFRRIIEVGCGLLSLATVAVFIKSFQDSLYSTANEIIALLMTVLTCWLAIAISRKEKVSTEGLIEIDLNTEDTKYLIPEIRVFRNVVLLDGNIAKRKISFEHECFKNGVGAVSVQRECKQFYDSSNPIKKWEMVNSVTNTDEHTKWVIKSCDKTQNNLRVIFACIYNQKKIYFTKCKSKLSHCIDIEIPYSDFAKKSIPPEILIRQRVITELKKRFGRGHYHSEFKFLMMQKGQYVIVGYVHADKEQFCKGDYDLSYSLTETNFAQKMKDDVTRVTCEYAIAEFIGYKMSNR